MVGAFRSGLCHVSPCPRVDESRLTGAGRARAAGRFQPTLSANRLAGPHAAKTHQERGRFQMTLTSQQTRVIYRPDGQTTVFGVPFPVFDAADVECISVADSGAEFTYTSGLPLHAFFWLAPRRLPGICRRSTALPYRRPSGISFSNACHRKD